MVKISIARENSDFNLLQSQEYSDYNNYSLEIGQIENYRITKRVAKGKYSEVFEGIFISNEEEKGLKPKKKTKRVIIKVLKPIKMSKINREVKILKSLSHPNIIEIFDIVKDSDSQTHSLIFEYLNHVNTAQFFETISPEDVIIYSRQILEALAYSHSKGIMHRDIKPQNLLINSETKILKVIDWGLSEFYVPKSDYPVKVATRYFKAPELLVGYGYYDYSLDIWEFGCIFAEMIFNKRPLFVGANDIDQLMKIAKVLGTEDLKKYCTKFEITLSEEIEERLEEWDKKEWIDFYGNDKEVDELALDLLAGCLIYDHSLRLTATECLNHPFFKKNQ